MPVRRAKLKRYLRGIKYLLSNPAIIKYMLCNPVKVLYEKYDSVVDNALYGNTRLFLEDAKIEILTIEDYLLKHGIVMIREDVVIVVGGSRSSSISILETQVLCMLAQGINAKTIFEIGTFEGKTAVNIARNVGDDAHVYTLDLPQEYCEHDSGKYLRENKDVWHKVTVLFWDSREFDFSPYYNQIDLMFIDGSHAYEAVLSDSENAVRCVRGGGFIVWHDFGIIHLASSTAILQVCAKYCLLLNRIDATSMAVVRVSESIT